jgi:opacity protein-like surface antigen
MLAVQPVDRAHAQVRFGANLSWADDADLGIGARVGFGIGSVSRRQPIEGVVSFDYFFPDDAGTGADVTYWEINANGIYKFAASGGSLAPYIGAGLNYARGSVAISGIGSGSESDVGLNLLGGIRFNTSRSLQPFAEARIELGGGEQLVLAGGFLFGRP